MRNALQQAASSMDHFWVLAGELERSETQWKHIPVAVDWKALAETGKDAWCVFRIHAGGIGREGWPEEVFARMAGACLAEARGAGMHLRGVQVDYDCPTEQLEAYGKWLRGVSDHLQGTALSITALPAWLAHPAFRDVVAGLDHFILQVHFLQSPDSMDSRLSLCPAGKIPDWITRACRMGTPFYVALPTYGYRAYFDETGVFSAIAAESPRELPHGYAWRDVYADPEAMASVVRGITAHRPDSLQGIAWFRLPVSADRRNWSWPVLRQVMRGQAPEFDFATEIRSPQNNLFELWIAARGKYVANQVCVSLRCDGAYIQASDTVNGFREEAGAQDNVIVLTGPGPDTAEPRMAGWWAVQPVGSGVHAAMIVEETTSCP